MDWLLIECTRSHRVIVTAAADDEEETAGLELDVVDCVDWLFELRTTKLYMLNLFGPPLKFLSVRSAQSWHMILLTRFQWYCRYKSAQ
jgi:hypothetical protein